MANICNKPYDFAQQEALYCASKDGDLARVEALLNDGADAAEEHGYCSPLHAAKTAEVALALLERGANMEQRKRLTQQTSLHTAAQNGRSCVVQVLLERGACVQARDMLQKTPLHYACIQGATETVQSLLEHGANVKAQDEFGRTPLYMAASRGMLGAVELLLSSGADLDKEAGLHAASRHGRLGVTRYLLSKGAYVNQLDDKGNTPLELAKEGLRRKGPLDQEGEFEEVIQLLERAASEIAIREQPKLAEGTGPLHDSCVGHEGDVPRTIGFEDSSHKESMIQEVPPVSSIREDKALMTHQTTRQQRGFRSLVLRFQKKRTAGKHNQTTHGKTRHGSLLDATETEATELSEHSKSYSIMMSQPQFESAFLEI